MYLTLPLPNIQEAALIINLIFPSNNIRFRGIRFGIVLKTDMNHQQLKTSIATKIITFVMEMVYPKIQEIQNILQNLSLNSPEYHRAKDEFDSYGSIFDFFSPFCIGLSSEGNA